jgi:hypothetical protein
MKKKRAMKKQHEPSSEMHHQLNIYNIGNYKKPNNDFNLTYLAVTTLAKQGSRQPKRRLNQR